MAIADPDATTPRGDTPITPAYDASPASPDLVINGRTSKGQFAPGHRPATPGVYSREQRRAARTLSGAIRAEIPPELYIEYDLALLEGKKPIVRRDGNGELYVAVEDRGAVLPTLEQSIQARVRLETRAYGQAPQSIQLEADIRAHAQVGTVMPSGSLPAHAILSIKGIVAKARLAHAAAAPAIESSNNLDQGANTGTQAPASDE